MKNKLIDKEFTKEQSKDIKRLRNRVKRGKDLKHKLYQMLFKYRKDNE